MRTLLSFAIFLIVCPLGIASVLLYAAFLHYDDRPVGFGPGY
jgi:hypothetical protein